MGYAGQTLIALFNVHKPYRFCADKKKTALTYMRESLPKAVIHLNIGRCTIFCRNEDVKILP